AEYDGDSYGFDYLPSFFSVWKKYVLDAEESPERILVDVPIGLRNDGEPRECDTEARKRVRSSTVYPTPSRPAVYESTYEEAKERNENVTGGTSLSTQTWAITPFIRELDEIFDEYEAAKGVIRESHPELCFWALKGERVETKKNTQEGYQERVRILEGVEDEVGNVAERAVQRYEGGGGASGVSNDDVLDALVLAVTARGELDTFPDIPPTDARGLAMEIVFRC
ncbi:MAG: DUF429 domain-containing protein, partial [Halobacteria archaeon]|nr:DUF429 domain-containing protein [Halobacteria archaeon]